MSTFDDNFPAKGNPKMSDRVFGFDSESLKNAGMTNQALYDLFKGNLEGEFPTRESLLPAFDLANARVVTSYEDGAEVKSNVINKRTFEYTTFRESMYDSYGNLLNDAMVDNIAISKLNSKYYKNTQIAS